MGSGPLDASCNGAPARRNRKQLSSAAMDRRRFLSACAGSLVVPPGVAHSQLRG